ncbi:MAG: anti-sigma F factor [Bacillota bacterium]
MDAERVVVEFPSRPENLALARVIATAFATRLDFTVAETEEISVAVSEAVSNAIIHGYRDGPGVVRMELAVKDGALEILVIDHGCGIPDVERARQPAYTTCEDRMGLGFVFMESFMDELVVDSVPGRGTTVLMRKRPEREGGERAATGQRLPDR